MRPFLTTTILSVAASVMLTIAAVLLGRSSPAPSEVAMLHLDQCAAPCWIGIVPGKTTFGEAKQRLKQVYGSSPRFDMTVATANNFEIIDKLGRAAVPFRVGLTAADNGPSGDAAIISMISVEVFGFSRQAFRDPFNFGDLYPLIPHPEFIATNGFPSLYAVPVLVNERAFTQLLLGDYNPQLHCNPIGITHKILRFEFYSEQARDQVFMDGFQPWRGFRGCPGQ